LHQVGDLFELNVKLRCQNVKKKSALTSHQEQLVLKRPIGNFCFGKPTARCSGGQTKHVIRGT
jgi:hypothetical protein